MKILAVCASIWEQTITAVINGRPQQFATASDVRDAAHEAGFDSIRIKFAPASQHPAVKIAKAKKLKLVPISSQKKGKTIDSRLHVRDNLSGRTKAVHNRARNQTLTGLG